MRPRVWRPPIEPSEGERAVLKRIKKAKLFVFLLDCEEPPFSKGTLVGFRKVLIEHDLDARLVDRTVEVAEQKGGFGSRKLRAALDSSPLWGAGRVEDTYNLLGHALRKALDVIARQQGRGPAEVEDRVTERAAQAVEDGGAEQQVLDARGLLL